MLVKKYCKLLTNFEYLGFSSKPLDKEMETFCATKEG